MFQPVGVASFVVCSLWLGGRGEIPPDTYWLIPLGLPALIAGCWLGWKLYGPLDESKFRKVVLILLLVSGTVLVFGDKDGFVRIARTSSWRARTPLWSRSRTRPLQGIFSGDQDGALLRKRQRLRGHQGNADARKSCAPASMSSRP